ncbi:MAG TPA: hypothetical protein VK864_11250 [Longimicrobiales bacterium]|nr:hypothetical protein [Longimicrobiales bacterium]
MKGFCGSVLTALVLAGMISAPGSGQTIRSPYRFIDHSQAGGPFAGYIFTTEGTVGLAPKGGPIAGGRYGIRLSGPFLVEGEVGYFTSTRPVRDTVVVDSVRQQVGSADFSMLLATAALRFNFTGPRTWHGLQPYVQLGGGAAIDLSGESPDDEKVAADVRYDFGTSFAGHLGGGIEWYPSDRITFRVDARNVLWKITTPISFLQGELGETTPVDEWVQNGFLTLGIALHF